MIKLNHNFVVDSNKNNYILMLDKHKEDSNKKPVYETLGYYSTLEGAIYGAKSIFTRIRLGSEVFNLEQALEEIRKIHREWVDMLEEVMRNDG